MAIILPGRSPSAVLEPLTPSLAPSRFVRCWLADDNRRRDPARLLSRIKGLMPFLFPRPDPIHATGGANRPGYHPSHCRPCLVGQQESRGSEKEKARKDILIAARR